jgi:hypothetical protein
MSRADISVKETGGLNSIPTDRFVVALGTNPTVKAGEPAKLTLEQKGTPGTVILLVDGDLTVATDAPFAGVAATDSTEAAAAAGYVDVYVPLPNVKWEIKAKASTGADTQAEIDVFLGELYAIDLTSSVFTMDMAGGTATTNAFCIVGGDPNRSTVHFRIRPDACAYGRASV